MRFATFTTTVIQNNNVHIPTEVTEKLRLTEGDRVEISLKKIKSGKFDLMLSENPLYKLLDIAVITPPAERQGQ